MSSHGLMHMVISNAHAGDPYKIDTLFMYMANMSWNSSMNTTGVMNMLTDKDDKVTGVEFQRMALGEPDASGRRRPQPVEGTEFIIDCDRVLLAIGQGPELDWLEDGAEGIEKTKRWRLDADAVTFGTGRAGVRGRGELGLRRWRVAGDGPGCTTAASGEARGAPGSAASGQARAPSARWSGRC